LIRSISASTCSSLLVMEVFVPFYVLSSLFSIVAKNIDKYCMPLFLAFTYDG
jgi:hypothetical protein